jgi:hypothetical protein
MPLRAREEGEWKRDKGQGTREKGEAAMVGRLKEGGAAVFEGANAQGGKQ